MSDAGDSRRIELDGLPAATFQAAVVFLYDALRECQLVLVGDGQGRATDQHLSSLAAGLVPLIEEIGDAFRAAEATDVGDGSLRLVGALRVDQAVLVDRLQALLIDLWRASQEGDLLLDGDPEVLQLLLWIWAEVAGQLDGRPPRSYRPAR